VLFIGDAAGWQAYLGGWRVYRSPGSPHAARVIGEALARGDCNDPMLSGYEKAWKGDFGRELDLGMRLFRIRTGNLPR